MKLVVRALEQAARMGRTRKQLVVISADALCCLLSIIIAFALRTDGIAYWNGTISTLLAVALPLSIAVFLAAGVYRFVFRFAGRGMMGTLARSFAVYTILLMAIFLGLWQFGGIRISRSLLILHPLIFFVLVAVERMIARYLLSDILGRTRYRGTFQNVMIYGAGIAGQKLAAAMQKEPGMRVLGYIDDDASRQGQRLDGLKVYHTSTIPELIATHGLTDIFFAIVSVPRHRRRQLVADLSNYPVHVRVLPGIKELAEGRVSFSDIREVEIEDLLGREKVIPDTGLLERTIAGKSVLVSGAGGTIGSELCRQIVAAGATQLLLYEFNEYALYSIHRELFEQISEHDVKIDLVPLLGTVTDPVRLKFIFETYRPSTVFHAAAYKHVPLVEANPVEAIRNNIFGTLHIVQAAQATKVSDFILISTDKAVRPTNIMGATKRCAELVLQAHAAGGCDTNFSMVRFGNVLGSSGSVVPLFRRQIANGGPVTLTDGEVTRYFMTIPEAAELVIQAAGLAEGGDVYLLDMGEAVKISELARMMIRLSGLAEKSAANPDGDIEVVEIGLRPGEKLYEELLIGDASESTPHPRIFRAHEECLDWESLKAELDCLWECRDKHEVVTILSRLVPGFTHNDWPHDGMHLGIEGKG